MPGSAQENKIMAGNFTQAQIEEFVGTFKNPAERRALDALFTQNTPAFGTADTSYTRPSYPGPTYGVTPAGVGITVQEFCADGYGHYTILNFDGVLSVLPAIAGGASLGVGVLVYTLPVGAQMYNASFFDVGITQTTGHINANTPVVGLGTTIASGAVSVLSGTATFQNNSVGATAANCTGTPTVQAAVPTANSGISLVAGIGALKTVYFNVAAAWAASGDPAAILTGSIMLNWDMLYPAAT